MMQKTHHAQQHSNSNDTQKNVTNRHRPNMKSLIVKRYFRFKWRNYFSFDENAHNFYEQNFTDPVVICVKILDMVAYRTLKFD